MHIYSYNEKKKRKDDAGKSLNFPCFLVNRFNRKKLCPVGFSAEYSVESQLKFRRNMLHPSSGLKHGPNKKLELIQVARIALMMTWTVLLRKSDDI
jgi:hypothetical protein